MLRICSTFIEFVDCVHSEAFVHVWRSKEGLGLAFLTQLLLMLRLLGEKHGVFGRLKAWFSAI